MLESTIEFHSTPIKYIPALAIGSLTPFFDSFQKWGARETTFKPRLIQQAKIEQYNKVLDLGCGTGTLTLLIKKSQPYSQVTGIDIDPTILNIARRKALEANVNIKFDLGTAFDLPYAAKSFDRIVSSLVFHHLTTENKVRALKEALRVLKVNGELHIADIGKPQNILMRLPSTVVRRTEEAEDNVRGLLPQMLRVAGFENVKESAKLMTIFGTISLVSGLKM